MAGNKNTALSSQHPRQAGTSGSAVSKTRNKPHPKRKPKPPKKSKTSKTKARRRRRDDDDRVTIFPQVKGKVIREVMFSHEDTGNVLVMDFDDRTALSFLIDPKPLVLPLDVCAHYKSDRLGADRRWEGLAGKGN